MTRGIRLESLQAYLRQALMNRIRDELRRLTATRNAARPSGN